MPVTVELKDMYPVINHEPSTSFTKRKQSALANPMKHIEEARRGSIGDCAVLADVWTDLPSATSLGALHVFLQHLEAVRIPTHTDPHNNHPGCALAALCLSGVSQAYHLSGDVPMSVIRRWPAIFKWSDHFYQSTPDANDLVQNHFIPLCMYSIIGHPTGFQVVVDTPGAVEMVAHLWAREDGYKLTEMRPPPATEVLSRLLQPMDEIVIPRVVRALGGNEDAVGRMAISRLKSVNQEVPLDAWHVKSLIAIIYSVSLADQRLLSTKLLIDAFKTVTKSLTLISKQTGDFSLGQDPQPMFAVIAGFGYVHLFREFASGYRWVSHIVQAGILDVWVNFCPVLSQESQFGCDVFLATVQQTLTQYSVYPAVIRALAESIMDVVSNNPHTKVLDTPAKDVWCEFYTLVFERWKLLKEYIAEREENVLVVKMRITARRNVKKSIGKRGIIGWIVRRGKDQIEGYELTKKSEEEVIRASIKLRARRAALERKAQTEYPGQAFTDMMFIIDYTKVPPSYLPLPLLDYKSFPNLTPKEFALHESNMRRLERTDDKDTLIEVVLPSGRDNARFSFRVGDFWDDDG
ncbi:hypothetical protein JAAARDRAFT_77977 [Jaapia argillacea MUCL 33604]|uniref:Uncharacterized protein n=1 Tax=Jaapia argillacea MUCL 33604 TaxID=933084 RepID=A0A067PWL1_9AGAM|nr:hypothetical protein JAAARDRAFT_77977 [Jaapia argillacea MUCL 33604]